jgi:hypothetical protein
LILDFYPPEPWHNTFLLFRLHCLWYFVTAALANNTLSNTFGNNWYWLLLLKIHKTHHQIQVVKWSLATRNYLYLYLIKCFPKYVTMEFLPCINIYLLPLRKNALEWFAFIPTS